MKQVIYICDSCDQPIIGQVHHGSGGIDLCHPCDQMEEIKAEIEEAYREQ